MTWIAQRAKFRIQIQASIHQEADMHMSVQDTKEAVGSDSSPIIVVVGQASVQEQPLQTTLTQWGFAVHWVEEGERLSERVVQANPDLILLDVGLAHSDGIALCRSLKRDEPLLSVPILFLTETLADEVVHAFYEAGGFDYVRKPLHLAELSARVRAAIDHRRVVENGNEVQRLYTLLESAGLQCHALNQPLQYIMGTLQLLMMDLSETDPIAEKMNILAGRAEEMGNMTRKLNEITRNRVR